MNFGAADGTLDDEATGWVGFCDMSPVWIVVVRQQPKQGGEAELAPRLRARRPARDTDSSSRLCLLPLTIAKNIIMIMKEEERRKMGWVYVSKVRDEERNASRDAEQEGQSRQAKINCQFGGFGRRKPVPSISTGPPTMIQNERVSQGKEEQASVTSRASSVPSYCGRAPAAVLSMLGLETEDLTSVTRRPKLSIERLTLVFLVAGGSPSSSRSTALWVAPRRCGPLPDCVGWSTPSAEGLFLLAPAAAATAASACPRWTTAPDAFVLCGETATTCVSSSTDDMVGDGGRGPSIASDSRSSSCSRSPSSSLLSGMTSWAGDICLQSPSQRRIETGQLAVWSLPELSRYDDTY